MKTIFKLFILLLVISCTSCEKMLEIEPRQSIDSDGALTSPEAVTAATNAVYARLREIELYGRDFIAIPELLADNAVNTGAGNRLVTQANNQPGAHMNNWQFSYYGINQINLILEALPALKATDEYKNNIMGQVLFLRALYYHNLLRVYSYDPTAIIPEYNRGGVPLVTTGVTAVEHIKYAGRNTIEEGYKMVYDDLEKAYSLLTDANNSKKPHFATKGAVAALFSRVALYKGDYSRAISEADIAMASGVATFPGSAQLISSWRSAVHPESFFEVVFATPDNIGSNESLRATFMTRTTFDGTTTASHGNVVVSDELFAEYLPADLRKGLIKKGLGNNSTKNEMTKFASKNGIANLDNVPVIRYAEVILNKAEALARLATPDPDKANTELNKIRTRAGLTEVTLTGDALIAEILKQRRIELAFEGHRFFDLKRLGMDIDKDGSTTITFDDYRILARIPTREVLVNKKITQNKGY